MVGADALDVARGGADGGGLFDVGRASAAQRKVDARVGRVLQDVVVLGGELRARLLALVEGGGGER